MPQIHAPELGLALRRRDGIRGAQGFESMSPELVPVVLVDRLEEDVALQAAGHARALAQAGEVSFVSLSAVQDALVHIHGAWISLAAGGEGDAA